jgi:tetratricopeptide (TPR) repeat protein
MSEPTPIPLLQAELRQRWQRGDHVRVEQYLEQRPELRSHPEALLDLIYYEIVLREESGETPAPAEYLERFPLFETELRQLFDVHRALGTDWLAAAPTPTEIVAGPAPRVVGRPTPGPAAGPRYEILAELGRGGMGVVHKARQTGLNRLVAVKTILAGVHAGPQELARFKAEAEAVARLQHPNIIQIHAVEEQDDLPCLVLELAEGGSLQRQMESGPQPFARAAGLVEALARAVHYAHQRGVIHRDLKPSNVLLAADGTPKITDFGLAKLLDGQPGPTSTGGLLGTPDYMSPEQAAGKGKQTGPATDVYALGAMLYEMLTGRPPFKGSSVLETLVQVRAQDPTAPGRLRPQCPRDLETVCLKCLEKDPARRYLTAEALADDLRRFLNHEPILARPVSPWRRAAKWARRRPAAAALLAVSVAAALSLLAITAWSAVREGERLARLRSDALTAERAGQRALARQDWAEAKQHFAVALARVGSEPSLQELRATLEDLHEQAGRRLREQQERHRLAQLCRDFLGLSDDVLIHAVDDLSPTQLFFIDPEATQKAAEDSARRALAVVRLDPSARGAWVPDPGLTEPEKAEVAADAYKVLLVLADTVARRSPSGEEACREALRLLDRALEIGPRTRSCVMRRAAILQRLGDEAGAQRERERAAALPIREDLDYFLTGLEHYRQGKLDMARRAFENAIAARPNYFWAHAYLAVCNLRDRKWERGKDHLDVCLVQRPDFSWALLLRGYAQCESGALEAAAIDFRQAERALERAPHAKASYVLCVNRGLLHLKCGKLQEAAADLERAARLFPGQYAARLNLARVYEKMGRAAEAAAQFRDALKLGPPALVLADHHAGRGRDLFLARRYAEAVAACRLALAQQADYPYALGVLAQALLELRRYPEAARAFDLYLARGGTSEGDVYRGRGHARMQLGDYLGAVEDYTRVLHRQPGAEMHARRGWAYFFADAWKPALRDFEAALKLDRDHGDAYTGRALSRVMLGRYREAVADAEQARRRKPSTPEMMHNLACVFAQAAAKAEADPKEPGRRKLAESYRATAVTLVRATLDLVPQGDRARFWREQILPDTALEPLRTYPAFQKLVKELAATP